MYSLLWVRAEDNYVEFFICGNRYYSIIAKIAHDENSESAFPYTADLFFLLKHCCYTFFFHSHPFFIQLLVFCCSSSEKYVLSLRATKSLLVFCVN